MGALLSFAGQAIAANPVDGGEVLDLGDGELSEYWTPAAMTTATRLDPDVFLTRSGPKPMAHTVTITYIVGSDGKVRDAEMVKAEPVDASGAWALVAVQSSTYTPTPSNANRVPVRMTHQVTLNAGPMAGDD